MLAQIFRIACKGYGSYCPTKNELRVRKRKKLYRISCGESELRFTARGHEELRIYLAPDATVPELKRSLTYLINSH